jgi:hypothetical protein
MSPMAKYQTSFDALGSALYRAGEPTLDLFAKIISGACTRIPLLAKAEAFDRLMHLAKIGAWTEAAFLLIALELPLWRVRRLVYEDGEWLCSLSNQPNLPIALDDCVEATHEVLPIAMFCAFVEARRRRNAVHEIVSTVSQTHQPWPEQSCAARTIGDGNLEVRFSNAHRTAATAT